MLSDSKQCPECGGKSFFVDRERGEVVCKSCSFVIEEAMLDFGRERALDSEDLSKRSRSGAPFDPRVVNNLSTEVGSYSDISKLPRKTRVLMHRIKKKNRWVSSSIEHNLSNSLTTLKMLSAQLKLPEFAEKEAARVYRECAERGITVARPAENVISGCIYISCRVYGIPKTMNEVSSSTGVSKKVLGKMYKLITRKLNINIRPLSPVDFISRFGSTLHLSAKSETKACSFYEKFVKLELTSGKSPVSMAATALYLAAMSNGEKVTQQKMAEISGITETTLRIRCKEMITALKMGRQFKGKIAF
jgi:transcription initiation factor TFIIB